MFSMCARLAISGTTPRYLAWSSAWVATTLERTSYPSATTAAAVSSQVDSMPRIVGMQGVVGPAVPADSRERSNRATSGAAQPALGGIGHRATMGRVVGPVVGVVVGVVIPPGCCLESRTMWPIIVLTAASSCASVGWVVRFVAGLVGGRLGAFGGDPPLH